MRSRGMHNNGAVILTSVQPSETVQLNVDVGQQQSSVAAVGDAWLVGLVDEGRKVEVAVCSC